MSVLVNRFEAIKDILIYVAVSKHAVTALELEEYVVDMARGQVNRILRALVADDYLIADQKSRGNSYTATLKTKQLFGLDMKNNQKIELAQDNKAQLLESCKQCLNCTAWVPELTDWDVMQSGYGDEQLYPDGLLNFPQAILDAERKRGANHNE